MAEERLPRLLKITMDSAQALLPNEEVLAAVQVVLKGSVGAGAVGGAVAGPGGGLLGGAVFGRKKRKQAKLSGFNEQTILAITPEKVHTMAWGLGGKAKQVLSSWERSAIVGTVVDRRRAAIQFNLELPDGNSVQLETLGRNEHIERAIGLVTGST